MQHCDEGADDSFSIIISLTYRKLCIFYTDGRRDPYEEVILHKGDVFIFNTLVVQAGTITVTDPSSTGLFIYLDRAYDTSRKKGYNWMAADEQEWTQRILPEEITKHEKRGHGPQEI